ncbi:MAG TPA: HAD hydrolase-like protein [Nitrolancea sp.]|nr:HAD hydrolase-like protein [Nitrolancea sp.]
MLLFDLDGTLIKWGDPVHLDAIDHSVHTLFPKSVGVSVHQIDFDGRVQRRVVRELLARAGLDGSISPEELEPAFTVAGEMYARHWEDRDDKLRDPLPGVHSLLERLTDDDRFALAIVTGTARGIAEVKLHRHGLSQFFTTGAYGDEVENRVDLVRLAISRAERHYGTSFPPGTIAVLGDTPHDIACGHACGTVGLGIATGRHSVETLSAAGAEAVVPDLTNTDAVIHALLTITGEG